MEKTTERLQKLGIVVGVIAFSIGLINLIWPRTIPVWWFLALFVFFSCGFVFFTVKILRANRVNDRK